MEWDAVARRPVSDKPAQAWDAEQGGMAEWTIAAVLKTAEAARSPGVRIPLPPLSANRPTTTRGGARVDDWDRLLSGCRAKKLYRGFESHPPRQILSLSATLAVADFLLVS